jgi:uncharacterized protein (DUF488 family)
LLLCRAHGGTIDTEEIRIAPTIFSVGHSTRSIDEFLAILQEADVSRIADVRAFPRSRRHPQFNGDELGRSLSEIGADYRHLPLLGGRRSARKVGGSRNTLWRVEAFRNYADYAETPAFADALAELERLARERPTAYMCAEAVWWRCHRRLITDYLLARRWHVVHLLAPGHREAGSLTPGAVVHEDGTIEYPAHAAQPRLI